MFEKKVMFEDLQLWHQFAAIDCENGSACLKSLIPKPATCCGQRSKQSTSKNMQWPDSTPEHARNSELFNDR